MKNHKEHAIVDTMGTVPPQSQSCKTGDSINIRVALPSDAVKLNVFVKTVYETSPYLITLPEEFASVTEEQQRERIDRYQSDDGHLMLVAEFNDQLIGMLDFQNGKRKRVAHIGGFGMSVHPNWRGKGVGLLLLQRLIDWASSHPTIKVIRLNVIEGNQSAIALYSKLGFEITGREPFGVQMSAGNFNAELSMSLKV